MTPKPTAAAHNADTTDGDIQRTPALLKEKFGQTPDLTTIQLEKTILFPKSDANGGADRFGALMSDLVEQARQAGKSPVFIWLVAGTDDLKHVLGSMKKDGQRKQDFAELEDHAAVFTIEPASPLRQLLRGGSDRLTLTAYPQDGGGYDFYRHFEPNDWQEGSKCTKMQNKPEELDDLVEKLHRALTERLRGGGIADIEALAQDGIATHTIQEFLK